MPSKACETLIYPAVSHTLRLVRLRGNTVTLAYDACFDRGAPLFFLILPLDSGAEDLSQKTDLEKKEKSYRMKNPTALGIPARTMHKKMMPFRMILG